MVEHRVFIFTIDTVVNKQYTYMMMQFKYVLYKMYQYANQNTSYFHKHKCLFFFSAVPVYLHIIKGLTMVSKPGT